MYPEKKGGSHKMARPQQIWGLLTLLTRWASIWTMPNTASPKSEPPCGRVIYTPVRATILGHPPQKTAPRGEGTPLELVENAKYLDMSINSDISWDFPVQRLCQNMYYHLSLSRQLHRIFPKDLLLQVYKSYIQPRLDYGITLQGFR